MHARIRNSLEFRSFQAGKVTKRCEMLFKFNCENSACRIMEKKISAFVIKLLEIYLYIIIQLLLNQKNQTYIEYLSK